LAKLALLWLPGALGVAVASPMINPQAELIICSSAGMVNVMIYADGSLSCAVQCPLCVAGSIAPPAFASARPAPTPA
jgi:hypothetical protein